MTVLCLGVDPGVRYGSGVAALVDGELALARLVPGDPAAQVLASPVPALLREAGATSIAGALMVEQPQVYRAERSRARPGDLVDLALVAGAWLAEGGRLGIEGRAVLPAAWKGQLPKGVVAERARAVLSQRERDVLAAELRPLRPSLRHNVLDALALALIAAGRLRMRLR